MVNHIHSKPSIILAMLLSSTALTEPVVNHIHTKPSIILAMLLSSTERGMLQMLKESHAMGIKVRFVTGKTIGAYPLFATLRAYTIERDYHFYLKKRTHWAGEKKLCLPDLPQIVL
jgi:hypothetical protein